MFNIGDTVFFYIEPGALNDLQDGCVFSATIEAAKKTILIEGAGPDAPLKATVRYFVAWGLDQLWMEADKLFATAEDARDVAQRALRLEIEKAERHLRRLKNCAALADS